MSEVETGSRVSRDDGGLAAEVERLRAELADSARRIAELEALATQDALVPVLNRRGFLRELERAIAYVARYGAGAALVFLDLDGFKAVNDRHGHGAGDAVLRDVAAAIAAQIRASDAVGRIGGDEFAVLLWNAGPDDARTKAASLAEAVAGHVVSFDGAEISVTASVGAAPVRVDDTAEEAMKRADLAMYAAKRAVRR